MTLIKRFTDAEPYKEGLSINLRSPYYWFSLVYKKGNKCTRINIARWYWFREGAALVSFQFVRVDAWGMTTYRTRAIL